MCCPSSFGITCNLSSADIMRLQRLAVTKLDETCSLQPGNLSKQIVYNSGKLFATTKTCVQ